MKQESDMTTTPNKPILVLQVAALGRNIVEAFPPPQGLRFRFARSIFPAMTCPVQATMRTAAYPEAHGMVANGVFRRDLARALFWEQSARLVEGPRIWDGASRRVGMLFWQQSLGERLDLVLSPKPIHKHHGGMIQHCHGIPDSLYADLSARFGPFNLMRYWGPLADRRSSEWIAGAVRHVLESPALLRPDLLFAYLPHLDYDLQRHGPTGPHAQRAAQIAYRLIGDILDCAERAGFDTLVYGDYAIEPVTADPVHPNRALLNAGLFSTIRVKNRLYPDLFSSRAFAMCDHQIAHVYVRDASDLEPAAAVLATLPGVENILDRNAQRAARIAHSRGGDLILVAKRGTWFAYPWWADEREAPDFASHIDIHNKPGYDPCELFFGWPPMSVSRNERRIRGTHGRADGETEIAWSASFDWDGPSPADLVDLALGLRARIGGTDQA